jgi:hypothetical protein
MQTNSTKIIRHRETQITLCICTNCGKEFTLPTWRITQKKQKIKLFCSSDCHNQFRRNKQIIYKQSVDERFWSHVQKSDGCWIWTGCKNKEGYGLFCEHQKQRKAYRVAYELTYGAIPSGKIICHKCNNPPCVRPDHLYAGTHLDNGRDMANAGTFVHKLTPEKVIEIRKLYAEGKQSLSMLSKQFGVNVSAIHAVIQRRHWKHI